MKKTLHNHAVVITVLALFQLAGCSGDNKQVTATKNYDAKSIGIQKFKGNNKPFDDVTAACVVELDESGRCENQAADLLIKKTGDSSPVKVLECQQAVQQDTSLKACHALTESVKTYDLIMAQRPTGRYSEKRAREMWGHRFIDIGE